MQSIMMHTEGYITGLRTCRLKHACRSLMLLMIKEHKHVSGRLSSQNLPAAKQCCRAEIIMRKWEKGRGISYLLYSAHELGIANDQITDRVIRTSSPLRRWT